MSVAERLIVDSMRKTFGGVHAVDDVSLSIGRGEIVGLVGPNGAGKTTLINVISGFTRPSAGEVTFEGRRITGRRPHALARIGVVRTFQHAHVFGTMTVRETLIVGGHLLEGSHRGFAFGGLLRRRVPEVTSRRVDELLERFGLSPWANRSASDLSYGLKKRLGVTVALVNSPEMIMLDEPAAGLNTQETEQLADDVRGLKADGISVLIVEHNMPLIMSLSDRIVVLNYGRKIADGSPLEVRNDPAVIGAYLGG